MYTAYDEMIASWCGAEDLESLEHVAMEAVTFLVGQVRRAYFLTPHMLIVRSKNATQTCKTMCVHPLTYRVDTNLPH